MTVIKLLRPRRQPAGSVLDQGASQDTKNWSPPTAVRRSIDEHLRHRRPPPARVTTQLQHSRSAVLALFPVRIFLAAGWIRAGAEKLIDRSWWTGDDIHSYMSGVRQDSLPFVLPIMDHGIAPMSIAVAFIVMATELAIGVAIGLGRGMRWALRWGVILNVVFVLTGTVNPSAFYLVMELVLLFAIADGIIGVKPSTPSRWSFVIAGAAIAFAVVLMPFIRTIEPAGMIADPAMMLAFVSVLLSGTVMLRWLAARTTALKSGRLAPILFRWLHAKPCNIVSVWRSRNREKVTAAPSQQAQSASSPRAGPRAEATRRSALDI